jgi:deoxyribonuclease V
VGVALRTENKVSPVYVSSGHLIDLDSALDLVLRSTCNYRQPEPTRQAHLLVNRLMVEGGEDEEVKD